jgi:zinc protease
MEIRLPYEQFTLANGLRVVVHEDRRTPLACVNIWYHVGSRDEVPGRTGFAHLFEHLMFEGSEHVSEGRFDELLEEVGGINNGSTSPDRTNYWEVVPAHAVDLALYLEADRMGGLLPAITESQLDAQRDVVMNERRQSYENRPYGLASETLLAALYPPDHPYHWPVIGSMADLSAATLADVHRFCLSYYTPGNATLAVAGDVSAAAIRQSVERYFADIPAAPKVERAVPPPVVGTAEKRLLLEDAVSLPRLYMAWHTPPAFAADDAALDAAGGILAYGRASRLYRSLIYDSQIAQSVSAYQNSGLLSSSFHVVVTARPGASLAELEAAVRAEIADMAANGVNDRELERTRNSIETGFIDALQTVGGFGGRADQLNMYLFHTGEPDYASQDIERYRQLTRHDVARAVHRHLLAPPVVLNVVPRPGSPRRPGGGDGVAT